MIDTERLRKAVDDFEFYSRPSSTNSNDPVTVQDINKLVKKTATVLRQFIEELEQN